MSHDRIIAGRDPHASTMCGSLPALRAAPTRATNASVADSDNIDYPKLRALIEGVLKPKGSWSPRALSLAASEQRNPDLVRNFLNDGTKPNLKSVMGLCSALELPVVAFFTDWDGPIPRQKAWLLVNAQVEAGAWREQTEWGPEDWYEAEVEPTDVNGADFGLLVKGRSMEKVLPPGTILRCADLITSGWDWQDGDYAIVERRRGGLTELTCKRLILRPDGAWELRAESHLEEFRDPIFIGRPIDTEYGPSFDGLNDDETRVRAVVVDAYLPLKRRRTRTPRGTQPAFFI